MNREHSESNGITAEGVMRDLNGNVASCGLPYPSESFLHAARMPLSDIQHRVCITELSHDLLWRVTLSSSLCHRKSPRPAWLMRIS